MPRSNFRWTPKLTGPLLSEDARKDAKSCVRIAWLGRNTVTQFPVVLHVVLSTWLEWIHRLHMVRCGYSVNTMLWALQAKSLLRWYVIYDTGVPSSWLMQTGQSDGELSFPMDLSFPLWNHFCIWSKRASCGKDDCSLCFPFHPKHHVGNQYTHTPICSHMHI